MSEHALLSASGASKWLNCTPSARLEETFPNSTTDYALEGTVAHALGELTASYWLGLISEMDFENRRDKLINSESGKKFFDGEMQECINDYAEFILSKLNEEKKTCPDAFAELEVRVDFSRWVPKGFGTSDCVIVSDNVLEIIDLKYGKGHLVSAEENPQMRLYALGSYEYYKDLYDIEKVKMTIFQPRRSGAVSEDEIDITDLLNWAEKTVKPKAKLAFNGEGEFSPSEETCKFCRAKVNCRARCEYNMKLFDDNPFDPALITADEAGELLEKASDIKNWLTDLNTYVESTLLSGLPVKGWKLVEGRSSRKITDEAALVNAMKAAGCEESEYYEKKLLTLTAFEKNFGKKRFAEIAQGLIVKPKGKPTLVNTSDPRPEYKFADEIIKAFDE